MYLFLIGSFFAYLPNTAYICNNKHGIYFLSQLPSRMIFGESPYKNLMLVGIPIEQD